MTERTRRTRPPLTLIANSQEWHSRSLESILGPHGYAVLRAYTGRQTLDRAEAANPDLIILDTDLPDVDGYEVCRKLRASAVISASTPIVMTSPGHANRQKRIDALRAGAWDFIGSALDGEELPLRLDAFMRARYEVERARDESLLDEHTGLYNIRGLARRARELGSQAFRDKEPFACIVLTPVVRDRLGASVDTVAAREVVENLARVLRETGRTSDVIGVLGPDEFAVIAQGTDPTGAVRLAERLTKAAAGHPYGSGIRMVAGVDAVDNYYDSPIEPSDMLMRASMAMRQSRSDDADSAMLTIRRFEGNLS